MIAVDTNLLVYAHRRESRHHATAATILRGLAEESRHWAIPWPCLYEFFSVVTHPRIWRDTASTQEQAWRQIAAWKASPSLLLLHETEDFCSIFAAFACRPRVVGPVIHDARIAAICVAHGVEELLSADRDFHLFPELPARNPL